MSLTKFLYLYPFAYTIDVSIEGKRKDLQRQGKVHHVFCLGDIVCIKLFENEAQLKSIISVTFLTSLRTWILRVNFCKYSICSVYIVKPLWFFSCEAIFIIFLEKLVTSLLPTPLLFICLLPQTGFTDPFFISFYFIDYRHFILKPR